MAEDDSEHGTRDKIEIAPTSAPCAIKGDRQPIAREVLEGASVGDFACPGAGSETLRGEEKGLPG